MVGLWGFKEWVLQRPASELVPHSFGAEEGELAGVHQISKRVESEVAGQRVVGAAVQAGRPPPVSWATLLALRDHKTYEITPSRSRRRRRPT